MKKMISTIILTILLSIIIIPIISYAGLREEVNVEASRRPLGPGDREEIEAPNDPIIPDPYKTDGTVIETKNCTITGNIWEDFKSLDEDIGTYTRNNKLDENEKGTLNQNNIRLEVRKVGSDSVYATPTVNSDGSYSFTATEEGSYYVRLYYGLLEDSDYNNASKVKSVLKYNGQDYICTKAGNNKIDVDYRYEIIASGKGCTQIYLAIDCSNSMIEKEGEVSRLESQIKSAKKLVEELLDENDNNIYIGIVAFGEYPRKLQGLTKSKEKLNKKLDQALEEALKTDYYSGTTDIYSVLKGIRENQTKEYKTDGTLSFKQEEYFVTDEEDKNNSNRYIFLLSDGIPLSDGETVVYIDDSEEEIYNKTDKIIDSTRKEMQNILDDGIKETVLITKTGNQEIDNYVKSMCDIENENFKTYLVGTDTATKVIADTVKENIMQTSISEGSTQKTKYIEAGKENSKRRAEINSNYNITYYYRDAIKFKILDNYNASNEEDRNTAKEISEKAYCFADTSVYELYKPGTQWLESVEEGYNPDGSHYRIEHIAKAEGTQSNVDIVLTTRENCMIKTDIKVTGARITLADGSILAQDVSENAKFVDKQLEAGEIRTIEDAKNPFCYYIDKEIMQSSTIDLEYTIILKNTSLVPTSDLEIMLYLPDGFSLAGERKMLTVDYTNQDYGWINTDAKILKEREFLAPSTENQDCAILKLSDVSRELIRDTEIGTNGERYLKVIVSKTLPIQEKEKEYRASAEVIGYSNKIGRRMQDETTVKKGTMQAKQLISVYAGNQEEAEFDKSERVVVIPPTGLGIYNEIDTKIKYVLLCSIIIISIIIFKKLKKQKV